MSTKIKKVRVKKIKIPKIKTRIAKPVSKHIKKLRKYREKAKTVNMGQY